MASLRKMILIYKAALNKHSYSLRCPKQGTPFRVNKMLADSNHNNKTPPPKAWTAVSLTFWLRTNSRSSFSQKQILQAAAQLTQKQILVKLILVGDRLMKEFTVH
jgi:hypothetical protein